MQIFAGQSFSYDLVTKDQNIYLTPIFCCCNNRRATIKHLKEKMKEYK